MDDWRLNGQEAYLLHKKLKRQKFKSKGLYDHDHCSFCWDKFSEHEADLGVGYCTEDEYYWICDSCFHDFKEKFGWNVVE